MRVSLLALLVASSAPAWSAAARPPKPVDVGERAIGPLGAVRPAAVFLVSPPQLPPLLPDELPTDLWPVYAQWLESADAGRRERDGSAEHDGAKALIGALDARSQGLSGAAWALLGALRRASASARYADELDRYSACTAAEGASCTEPVLDDAATLEAWSHVGTGTRAAISTWTRDLEGRLHDDAGREARAIAAYRAVLAVADAPPDVRADAALALGQRLVRTRSVEALRWLDVAAEVGVGDVAMGARFLRVAANARWGNAEAAVRDALAWPKDAGLATDVAPEVGEWAVAAAVRLGPSVVAILKTCGGGPAAHAALLLAAADSLSEQGVNTWARVDLDAAIVLAPEVASGTDALRERLSSSQPDDAASWASRVANWCTDSAPEPATSLQNDAPSVVVTLTPHRDGAVTTRLERPQGSLGAVAACLAGPVPPPECADVGPVRFRLVLRASASEGR